MHHLDHISEPDAGPRARRTRARLRRSAWVLAASAVLSMLTLATPHAASAAAVIDPIDGGRAGEGLVLSFNAGGTGTLVVTAPEHATIGIVTTGGCGQRYAAEVRCGTDSKVWASDLMATVRIDPDAPVGTLAGGSIGFEVGGRTVESTPFALEVLPPHVGQAAAGQTLRMEVPVNGGTSGVMRFTSPEQTVIVGLGASGCVTGAAGVTADCGTEGSLWEGVQTVDLAVAPDADYGTLRGGTMGFIQSGRLVSTTPFELELTPAAATMTTPLDGVLASDAILHGTAPSGTQVEVDVDGVPVGTTDATVEETWALQPAESLPEGTHTVTVRARAGGLVSTATDLVVTIVAPVEPITPGDPEGPEAPGVEAPGGQPTEPAPETSVSIGSPRGTGDDTLARTGTDTAPVLLALALLGGGAIVGAVGVARSRGRA